MLEVDFPPSFPLSKVHHFFNSTSGFSHPLAYDGTNISIFFPCGILLSTLAIKQ